MIRAFSTSLLVVLLALINPAVFAQEASERISGRGVLPSIETAQEYQHALELAIKNAVSNACASVKGQMWVSANRHKLEQKILSRAWDFVAEYRVVGKGKDAEGSWLVVEAQIFWDKLKDALAIFDLPELPVVVIALDKTLKDASWSNEFAQGLRYGLKEKGLEAVEEALSETPFVGITLGLSGKNKIRAEVKPSSAAAFVREFELADEAESKAYDAGTALGGLLIEKMIDEKVIPKIYEFVVELSGVATYADVVSFQKQLFIAGAVNVTVAEAKGGKIAFGVVALKPKEEILSRLVGLGFKVGAE